MFFVNSFYRMIKVCSDHLITRPTRGVSLGRNKKLATEKWLHLKDSSTTRNGVKYRSYSIAESAFVNGKNQKRNIKSLGPLTPEQADSYRAMLKNLNEKNENIVDASELLFEERKDFLNVAVLHQLWERFEFSRLFPQASQKEVSTGQIAEILTLAKLLKPSSHVKTVDWVQETMLSEILNINSDKYNRMKIFNELSLIEESKFRIEKKLFEQAKKNSNDEFDLYFVDGTTTFFEGTDCSLGEPGKDKTTGFKTHIILILIVTDKNGFPCAWEVCSGNKKEISEFKTLAVRMGKEYNIKNITFCFDRGFASTSNFEMIEGFASKFISGLDKNQIADIFNIESFQKTKHLLLERNLQETHETIGANRKRLPIDGFYTSDGNRYYKELGVTGEYRHIIGFNAEISQAELATRTRHQAASLLAIANLNEELSAAKKDRDLDVIEKKVEEILSSNKMQKIISFKIIPIRITHKGKHYQSAKIECSVNNEEWAQTCWLDGVFVYITDHIEQRNGAFVMSAYDVTTHYKNKYVIENDFRDLKNVIDIRPLFVRLPEHVKAAISLCMIAQFINIYIGKELKQINMSVSKFYELLNKSASVAKLTIGKRIFKKQIQISEELKLALKTLGISAPQLSNDIAAL